MKKEKVEIFLNDFIEERLEESYQEILKKDYYKKLIKKYEQLLDEITANISNKKLMQDFKEAEIDAYTIQLIKAYKKGFEDSIVILNKGE